MVLVRDVMASDPGISRKGLALRCKGMLVTEDSNRRLRHARSLSAQGQLLRDTPDLAAEVWSMAVQDLPSNSF